MKPSWWGLAMLVFALIALVLGTVQFGVFSSPVHTSTFGLRRGGISCRMEHLAAILFP